MKFLDCVGSGLLLRAHSRIVRRVASAPRRRTIEAGATLPKVKTCLCLALAQLRGE